MTKRVKENPPIGQEFALVASDYCALIEAHPKMSRKKFLEGVLLTLTRLYAAGVHLPTFDSSAKYQERRLTHKQWQALFKSLGRKLGNLQFYWEFFNPRFKDDPVAGNLADDLADIYRDIKPGLLVFEQGSTQVKKAVIWHWRFSLISHWGHHATGAIYVLHHLLADGYLP